MKRGAAVALVIAAVFLAYRFYDHSAPERRYKAFAEEVLHRRFDKAAAMCDGLTAADVAKGGLDPAMLQTLFPSRFDVQSRETDSDGTVTLHAVQSVLFNPPGVESAVRPAMVARLNQTLKLRKSGGVWKVVACENNLGGMDSLTR